MLGGRESGIDSVDHLRKTAVPRRPMCRIHDDIRVQCTAGSKPFAIAVAQFGQPVTSRSERARPIKEVQKVGQSFELEKTLDRPRQRHACLRCPLGKDRRLKAPLKMRVHLGLGQRTEPVDRRWAGNGRHVRIPESVAARTTIAPSFAQRPDRSSSVCLSPPRSLMPLSSEQRPRTVESTTKRINFPAATEATHPCTDHWLAGPARQRTGPRAN